MTKEQWIKHLEDMRAKKEIINLPPIKVIKKKGKANDTE